MWGSERPVPRVHLIRVEGLTEFAEYQKSKAAQLVERALPFNEGKVKVAPPKEPTVHVSRRPREEGRPPLLHPPKDGTALWTLCSINGMLGGNAPVPFPEGFTIM